MTRRKIEFVRLTNERDFPHLVELALPPEGFRDVLLQIDAFHRERRIPVRRGRSRYEVKPFYIRFCFPDAATADAFRTSPASRTIRLHSPTARRVNAGPARPSLCDRARRLRVVVGRRPSSKIVGGNSWPSLLSSLRPVLCAPKSALPSRSFCVFVHCQCAILDLKFTMGFAAKPDTIKQADVDCFSL